MFCCQLYVGEHELDERARSFCRVFPSFSLFDLFVQDNQFNESAFYIYFCILYKVIFFFLLWQPCGSAGGAYMAAARAPFCRRRRWRAAAALHRLCMAQASLSSSHPRAKAQNRPRCFRAEIARARNGGRRDVTVGVDESISRSFPGAGSSGGRAGVTDLLTPGQHGTGSAHLLPYILQRAIPRHHVLLTSEGRRSLRALYFYSHLWAGGGCGFFFLFCFAGVLLAH